MNNKETFFSIIIPTLNEEDYISNLLDSLEKQTHKDFEVIIVDNGSEDKTLEIIQNKEKVLSYPMQIVHCKQKGISYARNYGVKHANGKYLVFFDADGYVHEKWLERAYKIYTKNNRIIAVVGLYFYYPAKNIFKLILYNSYLILNLSVLAFTYIFQKQYALTGNNTSINKEAFINTGMFPHIVHEDIALSRNFFKKYKLKNIHWSFRMNIYYSPRRFDQQGFIRTYLKWVNDYKSKRKIEDYEEIR